MSYELHHGNCIDVMRTLPAESVDAIITSPPYAMQRKYTYGGVLEGEYPRWTVAWMAEAWRVLKPNGSVIINIRPHIKNGQISDYTLRTRLALRKAGWNEVDELIWHKTNAMPTGRPNKPRRSWESLHWFAKHGRPYCDAKANGRPSSRATAVQDTGQHVRHLDWDHYNRTAQTTPSVARSTDVVSMSKGNETTGHPAPVPVPLAEWLGNLVCPPGGTILDPFSGSASTGVAALRNGWDYIGIDAVKEYVDMSRERLEGEQGVQSNISATTT
jgi:DNA modification methylase